jgi:hypothetical protein
MIVNENFLKAKKDKDLSALVVAHRMDNNELRTYMYLCIREKSKYDTGNTDNVFVDTNTEFKIENYSRFIEGGQKREINEIVFHVHVYHNDSHVRTFLDAIKKDSDVKFKIVAYNGTDASNAANIVRHQLYGIIGEKYYLLDFYTGPDNLASPIK